MSAKTLFQKVWERNLIAAEEENRPAILHVGLHLIHEVTSPQAFTLLNELGRKVRRPDLTLATADHSTPTTTNSEGFAYSSAVTRLQVETLFRNCADHNIEVLDMDDPRRGIVHMIGPELGRTLPGDVIVCGDSHTSTHGAFGALAFGIGTTEVGHVLASQALFQRRPKTMRVWFDGMPGRGVSSKDIALRMIAEIGGSGAVGYVIEYAGPAISAMDIEARMTLCNLSIEAGARAGMIAPDDVTFEWLRNTPNGSNALARYHDEWLALKTDSDALFDREVQIDISDLEPMTTYGTAPDASVSVTGLVPDPVTDEAKAALSYMGFAANAPMADTHIDRVFIGSCTNGRISDLRAAASLLRDHRIAPGVVMLVVPGSESVRRTAEAEGLDVVFREAGAEWRLPGCSMCIAMNGDKGKSGEVVVSTSNRNFRGRQGEGVRTILASPLTAAASAIAGKLTDPRIYLAENAA